MSESDDRYQRVNLRFVKELHERLQAASDANGRSMNAEISARLDASFEGSDTAKLISAQANIIERQNALLENQKELDKSSRSLNFMLFAAARTFLRILLTPEPHRTKSDMQLIKDWSKHLRALEKQFTPAGEDLEYWNDTVIPLLEKEGVATSSVRKSSRRNKD